MAPALLGHLTKPCRRCRTTSSFCLHTKHIQSLHVPHKDPPPSFCYLWVLCNLRLRRSSCTPKKGQKRHFNEKVAFKKRALKLRHPNQKKKPGGIHKQWWLEGVVLVSFSKLLGFYSEPILPISLLSLLSYLIYLNYLLPNYLHLFSGQS